MPNACAAPTLDRPCFIRSWIDPVVDDVGHDPRSAYVERYWLGVLGPTATWLLRRLATGLEESPDGFVLDVDSMARGLGIAPSAGRNGPFARTLARLAQFGLARVDGDGLAVRRKLPPLSRRQLERLPLELQASHDSWLAASTTVTEHQSRRARRLALSLLELGEDAVTTRQQLEEWRFPPELSRSATIWARERVAAAASATAGGAPRDAA